MRRNLYVVIQTTEIWIPSEPDEDGYYDDYYDEYYYTDEVVGVFSNMKEATKLADSIEDAHVCIFPILKFAKEFQELTKDN